MHDENKNILLEVVCKLLIAPNPNVQCIFLSLKYFGAVPKI